MACGGEETITRSGEKGAGVWWLKSKETTKGRNERQPGHMIMETMTISIQASTWWMWVGAIVWGGWDFMFNLGSQWAKLRGGREGGFAPDRVSVFIESEDELCKQQVTTKGVQWVKDEMSL